MNYSEIAASQGGSAEGLMERPIAIEIEPEQAEAQSAGNRETERLVRLSRQYEVLEKISGRLSLNPDDADFLDEFDWALDRIASIRWEYVANQENTAPGRVMTSGTVAK